MLRKKIYKGVVLIGLLAAGAMGLVAGTAHAQDMAIEPAAPELSVTEEYSRAEVVEILRDETETAGRSQVWSRIVKLKIRTGSAQGREVEIEEGGIVGQDARHELKLGSVVVVGQISNRGQETFFIADIYRFPRLAWLAGLFLLLIILIGRGKALSALAGLVFSVFVLVQGMLPQLLAGKNPYVVIGLTVLIIACVSIFLAHGFSRRTSVAVAATLVTLLLAAGLAGLAVWLMRLSGLGTDEAVFLNIGTLNMLNAKGLLLGGIIVGVLGVLDDITTAQVAVVDELKRASPGLAFRELYTRAARVGREHIASLVNTLVLAYAGASLPLLLLFSINKTQPLWVILNSEFMSEEIVRTLVGSSALILAVPITTVLAAWYFGNANPNTAK